MSLRSTKPNPKMTDLTDPAFNYYIKIIQNLLHRDVNTATLSQLAKQFLDPKFLAKEIFIFSKEVQADIDGLTFEEKVSRRIIISSFLVTLNSYGFTEEIAAFTTIGVLMAYRTHFNNFLPKDFPDISLNFKILSIFFEEPEFEMKLIINLNNFILKYNVPFESIKQALREFIPDNPKFMYREFLKKILYNSSMSNSNLDQSLQRVVNLSPPPFDFHKNEIYIQPNEICQGSHHLIHFKGKCLTLSQNKTPHRIIGKQLTPLNLNSGESKLNSIENSKLLNPKYYTDFSSLESEIEDLDLIDKKFQALLQKGLLKEYMIIPIDEINTLILYSHSDFEPKNNISGVVI